MYGHFQLDDFKKKQQDLKETLLSGRWKYMLLKLFH